jgi:hypothetical protein
MAAEHHHFIRFVGAGDLADDVIGGAPLRVQSIDDLDFELDTARRGAGSTGGPLR